MKKSISVFVKMKLVEKFDESGKINSISHSSVQSHKNCKLNKLIVRLR